MNRYSLTPSAQNDLFEIWSFIAKDNPAAADEVEADILAACQELTYHPGLGHLRRALTEKPLRFHTVRRVFQIVYDPETNPLEIMRILRGGLDVKGRLHG